jgi:hypothetical protein
MSCFSQNLMICEVLGICRHDNNPGEWNINPCIFSSFSLTSANPPPKIRRAAGAGFGGGQCLQASQPLTNHTVTRFSVRACFLVEPRVLQDLNSHPDGGWLVGWVVDYLSCQTPQISESKGLLFDQNESSSTSLPVFMLGILHISAPGWPRRVINTILIRAAIFGRFKFALIAL